VSADVEDSTDTVVTLAPESWRRGHTRTRRVHRCRRSGLRGARISMCNITHGANPGIDLPILRFLSGW
jgi:hypothetical protein